MSNSSSPLLEVKNLKKYFKTPKGMLHAVDDVSFTIDRGRTLGVVGESGCGKTTLLKTMAGLIYPLSGEIYVDGSILTKAYKNDIYMMHQNYTCFNWMTCLDNILIIEKINHNKVTNDIKANALHMLERVGLKEYAYKYPMQLSGGMRQRLALARVLYAQPKILLMDEPLSALDEITRKSMQDLIIETQRNNKSTIILVTHSDAEAKRMCHEIIKM